MLRPSDPALVEHYVSTMHMLDFGPRLLSMPLNLPSSRFAIILVPPAPWTEIRGAPVPRNVSLCYHPGSPRPLDKYPWCPWTKICRAHKNLLCTPSLHLLYIFPLFRDRDSNPGRPGESRVS